MFVRDSRYLFHESYETHESTFDSVQSFLVPASGIDTECSKQTHDIVDGKSWVNMLDNFLWHDNHFPGRCRINRMAAVPIFHRTEPNGEFSSHDQKFLMKGNKNA